MSDFELESRIEMAETIGLIITLQLEDGVTAFTVNGMARKEGKQRVVHSTYCVCEPTPEALRALAEACDRFADRMTWSKPKEAPEIPILKPITAKVAKFTAPELLGASLCRACDKVIPKGEPFCSDECERVYVAYHKEN